MKFSNLFSSEIRISLYRELFGRRNNSRSLHITMWWNNDNGDNLMIITGVIIIMAITLWSSLITIYARTDNRGRWYILKVIYIWRYMHAHNSRYMHTRSYYEWISYQIICLIFHHLFIKINVWKLYNGWILNKICLRSGHF